MTTLLAVTLIVTPSTSASTRTSTPTDSPRRPGTLPREQAGELRALHPARAVGVEASYATVSWYGPGLYGNSLACGGRMWPSSFHVASRSLPCGTRLTICYRWRCRRTWVGDRGPYVYGRTFDLAAGLAHALGFTGVHTVSWKRR